MIAKTGLSDAAAPSNCLSIAVRSLVADDGWSTRFVVLVIVVLSTVTSEFGFRASCIPPLFVVELDDKTDEDDEEDEDEDDEAREDPVSPTIPMSRAGRLLISMFVGSLTLEDLLILVPLVTPAIRGPIFGRLLPF